MNETVRPNETQLEQVEGKLFNRMLKNAFAGFIKSAAIAAVIGLMVGAVLSFIPASASLLGSEGVALKVAAWFAGVAGSFGAVAGIQSTRDTRRYFLMHEKDNPASEAGQEYALVRHVDSPSRSGEELVGDFQKKLGAQEQRATLLQR